MNAKNDELTSNLNFETYKPKPWDLIRCFDDSVFLITNGKLFGPTAYIVAGATFDSTMMYLKYQGKSLQEVVNEIHKNHHIKKVERGFWKVVLSIIRLQLDL
jgi:hypothetical protein